MKKGKIFAFSAPSGSGKTTIVKSILNEYPEIVFSISATTRKNRDNEKHGIEYFFVTEEEFKQSIEKDEFVEWGKFYDYYYGTYKDFVENTINCGKSILLEVDVEGALNIKKIYPESFLIYIVPPSLEELEKRLLNRRTENEEDFKKRIERARMELSLKDKFDYLIENIDLDTAIADAKVLIKKLLTKED